jgi:uncharacterized protein (TIGR03083 family)
MMGDTDQQLVDLLEQVWASFDDACTDLTEAQWKTPTDLPGWTVQDNVVHIIGIESTVLGRPAPDHTPPDSKHIKNDIGRMNEVWVDSRRSWPGAKVLDEFRSVTGERIAQLRTFGDEEFGADSWTPAGPGTVRDLLPFRVFDSWAHEQDARRALERPGDLSGPVAEMCFERVVNAMPYVVGKKVHPPDGTTVVFDIAGPIVSTIAIGVEGGRAKLLGEIPSSPAATLTLDTETLACLGLGRWEGATALAARKVVLSGDEALGRQIVDEMNFMF